MTRSPVDTLLVVINARWRRTNRLAARSDEQRCLQITIARARLCSRPAGPEAPALWRPLWRKSLAASRSWHRSLRLAAAASERGCRGQACVSVARPA